MADDDSEVVEAVTLFERANGNRTMKLGEHEPRTFFTEDNELAEEDAEIVELDQPRTAATVSGWGVEDFPERVQEFFGVDGGDD